MYSKDKEKEGNLTDLAKAYSLSKKDTKLFEGFFEFLRYKDDFLDYLKHKKDIPGDSIPISVFKNKKLGPLETVVKYLREDYGYTYKKIGLLLNRKVGPIGVSYRKAFGKLSSRLDVSSTENSIPISIFKDSKITIFEAVVVYLKDVRRLKFGEIAGLLNRNYRTIWTVYSRARKKNVR